jgi:hypothetical protein
LLAALPGDEDAFDKHEPDYFELIFGLVRMRINKDALAVCEPHRNQFAYLAPGRFAFLAADVLQDRGFVKAGHFFESLKKD